MNAPFPSPISTTEEVARYDRLRLEMLDAFYELDQALEEWINDGKGSSANASTGCRIKALVAAQFPDSVATKRQVKRFANLEAELASAIEIRNLVVHSRASFGSVGCDQTLFLKPVGRQTGSRRLFFHATEDDLLLAVNKARSTAATLNGWRQQRDQKKITAEEPKAPSKPPPSPGAAGGP